MDRPGLLVEYGTGTGKTRILVESVAVLLLTGEAPILVCVPNSLIEQTVEEFQKWNGQAWVDKNLAVLDGGYTIPQRSRFLEAGTKPVYLLSHEALSYKLIREGIASRRWGAAFLDEASRFRNWSERTRTLKTLGTRSGTRYAFTGNLMVKSPADLFYVMNFLIPGIWGTNNLQTFKTEYCILGGFTGTEPIAIRPDRMPKLKALMDANRIQCELKDLREMPERTLSVRKTNLAPRQRKAYEEMRETLLAEIERENDSTFETQASTYAVRLLRLQEISSGFGRNVEGEVVHLPSPKMEEVLDLLEAEPDVPTVVWYWWRPERVRLEAELGKRNIPASLFGEPGARESFLEGRTNVFVSQLAKGGYGLNLTRATRMIYLDLPWDLDIYLQSQERNMRLTTTANFLEIIHMVNRGTVDEYVRDRLLDKAGISAQLSRSEALAILRRKPA